MGDLLMQREAMSVSEGLPVQEPDRWPCTKPCVRKHPRDRSPLPEVDRCTHEVCRPKGLTVVLDAALQRAADEPPHSECRSKLQAAADNFDIDIVISTAPPLVDGPYRAEGFRCPHGTTYYTQPTGEQIAQWARDGVR